MGWQLAHQQQMTVNKTLRFQGPSHCAFELMADAHWDLLRRVDTASPPQPAWADPGPVPAARGNSPSPKNARA